MATTRSPRETMGPTSVFTAELDANVIRQLPYHFAKAKGVIAYRRMTDGIEVWVRPGVTSGALAEVRRVLGAPLRPQMLNPELFERRLTQLYTDNQSGAAAIMDDMNEAVDLQSLAEGLPQVTDLLETEDDAPVIRFINVLLTQAMRERASDIHIEVFEGRSLVRYRIDGTLRDVLEPPRALHAAIISRVKVMASLDIAEKRLPQDGRITLRIAGRPVDVRVSTLPTGHGERVVLRLLDKSAGRLDFTALGMSEPTRKEMDALIHQAHGILLVTGPTGSGKTTTLYAALAKINSPDLNILTIEDPVEIPLKGIGQVQVNPKIELTFANGLRSFLRQDPDVIMVGEIRDLETAEIAIQASLTGHLVLSTVHTNDAAGAITRLVDMGVQPFLVASSLVGVLAQRLVRVLCSECRKPYVPTREERDQVGLSDGIWAQAGSPTVVYKAAGCPACQQTGYLGRTGIYELMLVDDDIRQLILKNTDSSTIKNAAAARGMLSLMAHGAYKVALGITTAAEVLSVTAEDLH